MKMNQIALSVIAAFALAACGSSGSSSKPTTGSTASTTPSTTTPSTGTQTGGTANNGGATNNSGTANNGGATNNGGADTGGATAGGTGTTTGGTTATTPATNTVATTVETNNHNILKSTPSTASSDSFVGFKTIVKKQSNLTTNTTETVGEVTNKADKPEGMQVQNPFPSFDTIVVGEERDANGQPVANGQVVYLEDFDFRGNKGGKDATEGKFKLKNIYINQATSKESGNGEARNNKSEDAINITRENEIKQMGKETGDALVFQHERKNYTPSSFDSEVVNEKGVLVAGEIAKSRPTKGTVAEVYGYRTNAAEGEYKQRDGFTSDKQANAPFQYDARTGSTASATDKELVNVQYGRVTSALHGQQLADLKNGLKLGTVPTKVGDFGKQGDEKTEDHYFYRGVNNVDAKSLADLKSATNEGVLTYNGHAVTYGMNHNWHGNAIEIPTAVGGSIGLVSGTHVTADLNLKNKTLVGNLYNKWYSSAEKKNNGLVDVQLVTFEGTLADNGNIAGTATYQPDGSTGLLGASLYGSDVKQATELGGTVASDRKGDNQWGAVFGATETKRVITPQSPTPTTPDPISQIGGGNNSALTKP